MAFINNKKYAEIRTAAKDGNEKALLILQAMRKMASQPDVDRLVEDYYKIPEETPAQQPLPQAPKTTEYNVADSLPTEEVSPDSEPKDGVLTDDDLAVADIVSEEDLDDGGDVETVNLGEEDIEKDMDGLIDEDDIDDLTFADFLSDKKKNMKRARKNAEYFKIYDDDSRKKYALNAMDKYRSKFSTLESDVDKRNKDVTKALGLYAQNVIDSLDDDVELDADAVDRAYMDFTDDSGAMRSFGRYWDDDDKAVVFGALKALIEKYGKKNVLAMMNTLKSDNENYKSYMHNKIDTEIGKYSKNLHMLLGE